jgi:acyl carrier protein
MSVADQISDIITRVTGIPRSRLEPEFDLIESGVVDSIQVLQLLGAIEQCFQIAISMDELAELTTIAKISQAIVLRTAATDTAGAPTSAP